MMDPQVPLTGVSKTALGVAAVRARESLRDDRLFTDPYAQRFLQAAPGAFADTEGRRAAGPADDSLLVVAELGRDRAEPGPGAAVDAMLAFHIVLRTRFFDDHLLAATAAGCPQVVLLAAGLDTRALRLAWPPGVRVFELDLPELFAFKEPVLAACGAAATCDRRTIPVDLRGPWTEELVAAGFDRGIPTAWLVEGLLVYLTADEAARLLTAVGDLSSSDSQLALERGGISNSALRAREKDPPATWQYTSLWKGGLGGDASDWLRRHRWRPQAHSRAALAASYGRPSPGESRGDFLTAVRADD
jgi:methyltransferase (TIGR00027 family)